MLQTLGGRLGSSCSVPAQSLRLQADDTPESYHFPLFVAGLEAQGCHVAVFADMLTSRCCCAGDVVSRWCVGPACLSHGSVEL